MVVFLPRGGKYTFQQHTVTKSFKTFENNYFFKSGFKIAINTQKKNVQDIQMLLIEFLKIAFSSILSHWAETDHGLIGRSFLCSWPPP